MFGIGASEILVIIVVAVLVLGPEHLPRIIRTVTKVMSDIRRVSTDFQRTINLEANQEEWKQQQAAATTVKKKKKVQPSPHPESAPAHDGQSNAQRTVSSEEAAPSASAKVADATVREEDATAPRASGEQAEGIQPQQGNRA